jgi:hypothetical protein
MYLPVLAEINRNWRFAGVQVCTKQESSPDPGTLRGQENVPAR